MNDLLMKENATGNFRKENQTAARLKGIPRIISPIFPAIAVTEDGTIVHLTITARNLLNYAADQIIENSFFSLVHDKNISQVKRDISQMSKQRKMQASWLLRLKTGKDRWNWFKAIAKNHLQTQERIVTIVLREFQDV